MRNRGQMAALGRAVLPMLQAQCVGGTTLVNSAIAWRLPEKMRERWCKDFGLADGLRESTSRTPTTTLSVT